MAHVLVILFLTTGSIGAITVRQPVSSVVAEFGSLDACWHAADAITRAIDRDAMYGIQTMTTCVPKGQPEF